MGCGISQLSRFKESDFDASGCDKQVLIRSNSTATVTSSASRGSSIDQAKINASSHESLSDEGAREYLSAAVSRWTLSIPISEDVLSSYFFLA